MTEPLFNIVYSGEIIAPDRNQVIGAFAHLFKLDQARAEAILSASRRVLKKNLPEAQAQRYLKALSGIGVLVHIEPATSDPEALITLEPDPEAEAVPESSPTPPAGGDDAAGVGSDDSDNNNGSDEKSARESDGDTGDAFAAMDASQLSVEQAREPAAGPTLFNAMEDNTRLRRLQFTFTGNGAEFFRIWIVNVVLSIITLGIYSAWAKVRTNRYLYRNTWLSEATFDYLADPVVILKGRAVAAVLFIGYTLSEQFVPWLSPILFILLLLVLPWLIYKGLRFRMRNTAYRNIRFGFEGTVWGAAKSYSLMFFLLPFTLGLLIPYMFYLQARYLADNTRYGVDMFSFDVSPREYYRIYILAFLALIATGVVGTMAMMATPVLGGIVFLAGYTLVMTYVKVETLNLMFDNVHLGDHEFSSTLEIWPYFQLYFTNAILIVLTLGLFYPWARVRIVRYRLAQIMMMAQGSLDHYVAAQEDETSAIGEEVSDMFDFDIGF